jgi:hypothetical protein
MGSSQQLEVNKQQKRFQSVSCNLLDNSFKNEGGNAIVMPSDFFEVFGMDQNVYPGGPIGNIQGDGRRLPYSIKHRECHCSVLEQFALHLSQKTTP